MTFAAVALREQFAAFHAANGADHGEPFDAHSAPRFKARAEWSLSAHLGDRAERGIETPIRARQQRAHAAALAVCGATAPGLVSVPTSPEVATQVAAEQLDCLLLTDANKAKRRLMKLRMSIGMAARGHAVSEKGHRSDKAWMVTFTYRPGVDWSAKHVSEALRSFYHWCKKHGHASRYVWIAEIQDGKRRADGVGRQVIHYHAVVWLPAGVRCPHFDRRGWWPHGMTRTDPPVQAKNPVGYLLAYLKKDKELSAMPKGARAYGVGGLDHAMRRARRWLGLPAFVQGNSDIHDQWKRATGGGWLSPGGVVYPSEFQRVKVGGIDALQRVCTHARSIEASGPFSWSDRGAI